MRSESDLSKIARYFLDSVAVRWVWEASVAKPAGGMRMLLETVLEAAHKPPKSLTELSCQQVGGTSLIYGMGSLQGNMLVFFYFEDDEQGLLVSPDPENKAEVHYFRFQGGTIPPVRDQACLMH